MNIFTYLPKISAPVICVFLFLTTVFVENLSAQNNALFVEVGGNSRRYALNYERTILRPGPVIITLRVGLGYSAEYLAVPIVGTVYFPLGTQKLFASIGSTPFVNDLGDDIKQDVFYDLMVGVGYRYTLPGGKIFIQGSVHPLVQFDPTTDSFFGDDPVGGFRFAGGAGIKF